MDNFILEVHKTTQASNRPIVRLDNEAYSMVNEVKAATGLSITHIVSEAIKFALNRVEIRTMNE